MAKSLYGPIYWFIFGPFTNLPFGICAIYFDLKVYIHKRLPGDSIPDLFNPGSFKVTWKTLPDLSVMVYPPGPKKVTVFVKDFGVG